MGLPIADVAVRLLVAALCGGALGLDREARGKSAGLRTHTLVAVSSAATTIVAFEMMGVAGRSGVTDVDPTRVIQGIAQAVGFISAGVIIRSGGSVRGATSAALIWIAGALGIACGAGFFVIAGLTLGISLFVLIALTPLERRLFRNTDGARD